MSVKTKQEPEWLNPDPEFQYTLFNCNVCGEIWLKYDYVRGSNFNHCFLKFICCEKRNKIPYKAGTLEEPSGKIVCAEINS